jgi:hypothetical protein
MEMINKKTIELSDKAKNYLEENTIYTCKDVCYGYSQKLIELVIQECVEAAQNTDFRSITYTSFDKDRISYCKEEIVKNIRKVMV